MLKCRLYQMAAQRRKHLLDQLRMLDTSLKDVAKSAYAGDAETLVTNGQFLQAKFSETLAFRP